MRERGGEQQPPFSMSATAVSILPQFVIIKQAFSPSKFFAAQSSFRYSGAPILFFMNRYRPDKDSWAKSAYDKNRKRILAEQEICAICGQPVNKALRFPHPMSASIDHIIPIAKGGHPSDIENLQLTHLICNQVKGTRLVQEANKDIEKETELVSNRILPQSMNWIAYRS